MYDDENNEKRFSKVCKKKVAKKFKYKKKVKEDGETTKKLMNLFILH